MSQRLRRAVRRRLLRILDVDDRPWPRSALPLTPRPPAPGESCRAPGFVGVGSQKCGTSWWHSLLNDHPDVVASVDKELHYFDRFFTADFGQADIDAYHALFPVAEGQLSGEWTPRYLSDPWVPALLSRAAPDTRVLVLLRDPLDRYVSGITHDLARGAPSNPLLAAMHAERGDYAPQLERLLQHFDRDQVIVQQYEACVADPATEWARTVEFLGLDPAKGAPQFDRQVNTARQEKPAVPEHMLVELRERYRAQLAALAQVVPELDVDRWTTLAGR
ncbi:MAG: sulfotransferase domain-containing protein [Actinomycetota bacterium]|jgi:hypothetical protein|nr:sulfotransferase domain-containing protein [Actinomycetota bacterium]